MSEVCLPPGGAFTVNSECATGMGYGRRVSVAAERIWGFRGGSNFIDVYKKEVIS